MDRSQVAGEEDGLQEWRVAASILIKQSRSAKNGQSSSLGGGCGANSSSRNKFVVKCHRAPRTETDPLDKRLKLRKWISDLVRGM
jgi:hypothetical protein